VKILIIGNINAGKTTAAFILSKELNIKFKSIDYYRKKYGDLTIAGDYLAYYHFLKAAQSSKDIILEFSGVGFHKYAVRSALKNSIQKIVIIYVRNLEPLDLDQFKNKVEKIPFPYEMDTELFAKTAEWELTRDFEIKFWKIKDRDVKIFDLDNNRGEKFSKKIKKIIQDIRIFKNNSQTN